MLVGSLSVAQMVKYLDFTHRLLFLANKRRKLLQSPVDDNYPCAPPGMPQWGPGSQPFST
jgi:hypothetical protein